MILRFLLLGLILLSFNFVKANLNDPESFNSGKGKIFFYWGWNRAWYSKSNIKFEGDDYNFVLKKVVAKDRPTPFNPAIYLNPLKLTIPQTNFKIGYHFWDNYFLGFGFDHMKYVVENGQTVTIDGVIKSFYPEYNKTFKNENIVLSKDFLEYEHTDGLNYVNFEIGRTDLLFSNIKKNISLYCIGGADIGLMYPRSDVDFIHFKRNDEFHITGYGTSFKIGLRLILFKYFSVLSEAKGGFINMPAVHPTSRITDRAKQSFFFFQNNFLIGGVIQL